MKKAKLVSVSYAAECPGCGSGITWTLEMERSGLKFCRPTMKEPCSICRTLLAFKRVKS